MQDKLTEKAAAICRDFDQVSGERGNWESHWREIAERILPADSKLFGTLGNQTQGEKRNDHVFDSTGQVALKRFGAILDSFITPRNQTYHRLQVSDPRLAKNRDVSVWFEEYNRLLFKFRYQTSANFAGQNNLNFISVGAYGTGCMFTDLLSDGKGLRYKSCHLSNMYFRENHQGTIDEAFRRIYFTASQLMKVKAWEGKLPQKIKDEASRNSQTLYTVIHKVEPNLEFDPGRKDFKGMEFYSCYILKDQQSVVLEEGGYHTFPYSPARQENSPFEVYGRSPAMDVLPALKTLNEQKKTILKQGHRTVDPVLLIHDDGVLDGFSMKPGALNAGGVSADGRALVQTLPVGRIDIGKDLMDDERAVINDAFFISLFQILMENPEMSATEVVERVKEKGILVAPTMGRVQNEYLGHLIPREMDLLQQLGVVPPMPQVLKEAAGEYKIEYDSPLSRAQRAEEASGMMRTIETALTVVNVTGDPAPLNNFNWQVIIPEIADINGVPKRWLNSPDVVAQLSQQQAQQKQAEMEIQAAPAAASMMKASQR